MIGSVMNAAIVSGSSSSIVSSISWSAASVAAASESPSRRCSDERRVEVDEPGRERLVRRAPGHPPDAASEWPVEPW